jgi:hypothetical protein
MSSLESPVKPVPGAAGAPPMNIVDKSDQEILAMADLLWRDLVKNSNEGKYGEFVRNFSSGLALAIEPGRRGPPVRQQRSGAQPVGRLRVARHHPPAGST